MSSGTRLVFTRDDIGPNLGELTDDLDRKIGTIFQFATPGIESWMKTNAPWTDRTGNARNGLKAEYEKTLNGHSIHVFHQVPYGIWLEVRFEGRYAIIEPTVKEHGPRVMGMLNTLFRSI